MIASSSFNNLLNGSDSPRSSRPGTPVMVDGTKFDFTYQDPDFLMFHKGTMVNYPYYESLTDVDKFEAFEDDVCLITFPKAGRSLFRAIIHMIRHDGDPACMAFDGKALPDVDMYLEFTDRPDAPVGTRTVDKVKQQPRPRFYATHLGYEAVPKSILEKAKIIYVARNPKDVIVSTHFFFSSLRPFAFSGTLEDTATSYINDKSPYTPFHKHVASFWKHRDQENILFLTYEDTLMNFRATIDHVAKFMGKNLTEEQLENIVRLCSFDSMRKNKKVNRTIYTHPTHSTYALDPSASPFIRSGTYGNWKKHFTIELNETVDRWIKKEEHKVASDLAGFHFRYE